MPRVGLDRAAVVAAGAALADEVGFPRVTMALVAARVGVRTPSLYKHVADQGDLNRRIAALAVTEAADAVIAATNHALPGRDSLTAAAHAFRDYVRRHPGRYAATDGVDWRGPHDPVVVAGERLMSSLTVILEAYPVKADDMVHALRAFRSLLHGFVVLEATSGFRWSTDVDDSFEWLITVVDRGFRTGDMSEGTR